MVMIALSLLAAERIDKAIEAIRSIESGDPVTWPDLYHIDVMDGVFVPEKTMFLNRENVREVGNFSGIPLSAHLMVSEPGDFIKDNADVYSKSGVRTISFHYEAAGEASEDIALGLRGRGIRPGLSINPGTEVDCINEFLPYVDLVLVMSVEPGRGGQEYNYRATHKIRRLRELGYRGLIEVDGGIKLENKHIPQDAGADILVSGTGILLSPNPSQTIYNMRINK